jgi:hypothetical protein
MIVRKPTRIELKQEDDYSEYDEFKAINEKKRIYSD